MKWEVPYVLVLLLIFNILAIYPSADFDFTFDANGAKHYTLTPEISDYDNPLDDLTNVLFIRYGNPWNINTDNNFKTFNVNQNEDDSIFVHDLNNQLEKLSTSIDRTELTDVVTSENYNSFVLEQNQFETESNVIVKTFFDSNNDQTFFVLLVPLAGFILIRSEGVQFKNFNSDKILSFGFIIILLSSGFTTPAYFSISYWGTAYGLTANNTENLDNELIKKFNENTSITLDNNTFTKSETNIEKDSKEKEDKQVNKNKESKQENKTVNELLTKVQEFDESTTVIVSNSTSTEVQESDESTMVIVSNSTSTEVQEFDESTTVIVSNSTSTEVQEFDESTTVIVSNSTRTEAIISLGFEDELTDGVLTLDGENFIKVSENATNSLNSLTLLAWVKPDYSKGSSEFTVISKEKSFSLAINNNIKPSNVAKFSVFDGIKWTTVESTSTINEEWTFVAATFDSDSINIFVNGEKEKTEYVSDIPSLRNGKIITTTVDNISSEEDIVIGAYVNTKREEPKPLNKFSGLIDDVKIYNDLLTDSEIYELYSVGLTTIIPSVVYNDLINKYHLEHEQVKIGEPVNWSLYINYTDLVPKALIELPIDAEILFVETLDDQEVKNLTKLNSTEVDEILAQRTKSEDSNFVLVNDEMFAFTPLDKASEMKQENKQTKFVPINKITKEHKIKFKTPAPHTVETDHSTLDTYNKKVVVGHDSALHYTNVKSFSELPEELVERGVDFKLYWYINNTRINVTNDPRFEVKFVDANNNGIVDQMEWIVPQLSEQVFEIEADIEIINVQSYPVVGGKWIVKFTTIGTADLIITGINGTTFGETAPDDLKFLELNNGIQTLSPIIQGNSITYYNYSSTQEGFESSLVLTTGEHHLQFNFGNDVAFAHNDATSSTIQTSTVASGNATGNSPSLSYTLPAGNDRLLLVNIVTIDGGAPEGTPPTISSVTFNGQSLSVADGGSASIAANGIRNEIYFRVMDDSESSTASSVSVSLSGAVGTANTGISVITLTGVNQTTPIVASDTNSTSGTTSISASPGTGSTLNDNTLILDSFGLGVADSAAVPDISQTSQVDSTDSVGQAISYGMSTKAISSTASSNTMIWDSFSSEDPTLVAIEIKGGVLSAYTIPVVSSTANVSPSIIASTIPIISSTASGMGMISAGSVPVVSSSASVHAVITASSTPVVSSTANVSPSIIASTTPTISSTASGMGMVSAGSVPVVSDSASVNPSIVASSTPAISSTASGMGMISAGSVPVVSSSASVHAVITASTTPAISSTASGMGMISAASVPAVSDSARVHANIIASTTPAISSDATVSISASTAPVVSSDAVVSLRASSTPIVSDDSNLMAMIFPSSTPVISSTASVMAKLSAASTPVVSDSASVSYGIIAASVLVVSDSASISPSIIASTIPIISSTASGMGMISAASVPVVSSSASVHANIIASTTPAISSDATVSISASTAPVVSSDAVVSLRASSTPVVSDSESIRANILATTTPSFVDAGARTGEVLVLSSTTTVTLSSSNSTAIVATPDSILSDVIILPGTTTPILDYSNVMEPTIPPGATVDTALTITASNTNVNAIITIPANGRIASNGWDGVLSLPYDATVTIPGQIVLASIGFGDPDRTLSFNPPVKITLEGQAGNNAFITDFTGTSRQVTVTCDNTDPTLVTNIPTTAPQACKINENGDLSFIASRASIFSSTTNIPAPPPPVTTTSSGGGGGGGGGGGAAGPTTGSGGSVQDLYIYEVYYDTCKENILRIIAGAENNAQPLITPPAVKLRSPTSGVYYASLATEQPLAEQNKYIYEAGLQRNDDLVIVYVESVSGRQAMTSQKTINMSECEETIIVRIDTTEKRTSSISDPNAPQILEVFYVTGFNTITSSDPIQFVESGKSYTIGASIQSLTNITNAELRYSVGKDTSNYNTIKMSIKEGTSSSYITVSGIIPADAINESGITYWIRVENEDGKVQESSKYQLTIKSDFATSAIVNLQTMQNVAQGKISKSTIQVISETVETILGKVYLLVNGEIVFEEEREFITGNTVLEAPWKAPKSGKPESYDIKAKLVIYGNTFETETAKLNSFVSKASIPLSELTVLSSTVDADGEVISYPAHLYSSNKDKDSRFRVSAPDGTCIIGGTDECLVKELTRSYKGNFVTVIVIEQIYRVSYSGAENPLERFSISSVDPIVGEWKIQLESIDKSNSNPQIIDVQFEPRNELRFSTHLMDDIDLKVDYNSKRVQISSTSSDGGLPN